MTDTNRAVIGALFLLVALSSCASDLERGLQYCRDNYFGVTRSNCERQIHGQHGR